MKRFILFWALLVWLATPAWAADTNKYPATLLDQTCTDSFDTPTAVTAGLVTIGGGRAFQPAPAAQTSGSGDGFCDNDSRIVTGALAADKTFGPFNLGDARGVYLFVDADTVTGGTTDWRIRVFAAKPHSAAQVQMAAAANVTGAGDVVYSIGPTTAYENTTVAAQAATVYPIPIPDPFYVALDLTVGGATSWTGEISMLPFY
jgi:hypothetical protein